ncbi:organic cyclic compound binding protein [[Candida] boidinii]|nr:organic cyclic compound binding protein [[Candida] boidinii]OWB86639.1 organic cyclic compound binding protein [[Candida] boidinii]
MVLDTKTIIKTLEKFTACDVSDALVKKGFKNGGFFPNLIRQSKRTESSTSASSSSDPEKVTPPMVGFAYTVLFAPYDDPHDNGVVRLPASYEADGDSAAESGSGVSPTLQAILEYIPKRVAADELVAEDIKAGEKATVAQKHRRQGL